MAHAMSFQFAGKLLPLPKLIIIVPDDDIIKLISTEDMVKGFSKPVSRLLNYLMTEYEWVVAVFKELLPACCVQSYFPHFLWIQPPHHVNFKNNALRYKFNKCLDKVSKLHTNCSTLMLKKVWDPDNVDLYLKEQQRYTAEGFKAYWEAVDRTARYFDSIVLKKQDRKRFKKMNKASQGIGQKDRFRWQNPNLNVAQESKGYQKLPPPPGVGNRFHREY